MNNTEESGPQNDDQQAELERLERLAHLLDDSVEIPFTRFRIGLDPLIGLIPGVGDLATALVSLTIIYRGWRMKVGFSALMRMSANVVVDLVVGTFPLVGDMFDMAFKSNLRNVDIIKKALQKKSS